MKINKKPTVKPYITGAFTALVAVIIGIIIGISICPQRDYSACLDVAEQDRYIVSQDGVITDLAIQTMNGRNHVYNKDLAQCLELRK